jgi:hypothetical protein
MSDYRVATGTDIALGSLTVLTPQPRSKGVQYARTTTAASGIVYREGAHVTLEWSVLASATAYQSLLATFGLSSAQSAAVTVYVRDSTFALVRYNGRAVRPEPGRGVEWEIFPRNVRILIKDLAVAA